MENDTTYGSVALCRRRVRKGNGSPARQAGTVAVNDIFMTTTRLGCRWVAEALRIGYRHGEVGFASSAAPVTDRPSLPQRARFLWLKSARDTGIVRRLKDC